MFMWKYVSYKGYAYNINEMSRYSYLNKSCDKYRVTNFGFVNVPTPDQADLDFVKDCVHNYETLELEKSVDIFEYLESLSVGIDIKLF